MKELSPQYVSPIQLLSNTAIECLELPDVADEARCGLSGRVIAEGSHTKWCWMARGSALEVARLEDGGRQASYKFMWSPSSRSSDVYISCVSEFIREQGEMLLVGLRYTNSSSGMVCLFDPAVSQVVKAVRVPYAVTALDTLSTVGGSRAPLRLFNESLRMFFGVVAVATEGGHVYLMDMHMDDERGEFDEWNPSHMKVFPPGKPLTPADRLHTREQGGHLCIELGGEFQGKFSFSVGMPDKTIAKTIRTEGATVTAVKYIPQIAALVVGFHEGFFQMWDIMHLQLTYTSDIEKYIAPVMNVAFQEPENDPRHCCYLWIARCPPSADDTSEAPTTLTLYQLAYDGKEMVQGCGCVYKEFLGAARRFEHQLTGDAHHLADAISVGSQVICCRTLERPHHHTDTAHLEDSTEESARDLTRIMVVWEAPSHDQDGRPSCHLGIFDINRWYHAQMPGCIRDAMYGSKDPTCPFFAFYSLSDVLDVAAPDFLLDMSILSLSRFTTSLGPAPDQFYWPASLTFDAVCLMDSGIIKTQFLGLQRQTLTDMVKQGPLCLGEASLDYFNRCWVIGLLPKNFDWLKLQDKSLHAESLLTVALEHGCVKFITLCIHEIGSGNITHAGCTLRHILDWAWGRVVQTKETIDHLCIPLFDGGGGTPDEQILLLLEHNATQLEHLIIIFNHLINLQSAPTTQQGRKDLEDKLRVVTLLSEYMSVILALVKLGVLPESPRGPGTSQRKSKSYPGHSLGSVYSLRRQELAQINSELGDSGLSIDKIISQMGSSIANLWSAEKEEPGASGLYPPINLHALCSIFLLDSGNLETKHSIVYYLLLDMCFLESEMAKEEVAEKFASAVNMSLQLRKLVRGFWELDHELFESAVRLLVSAVKEAELGPWQNAYIIKTLVAQDEISSATYFISRVEPSQNNPEDIKLYLQVMLMNGLISKAFSFQRHQCQIDPRRTEEILEQFYVACQHTKNMGKLLEMPLNQSEEVFLQKFLLHSEYPNSKELLIMHYLQRRRYVDAIRLNEALKQNLTDDDSKAVSRAKVRNLIIEGYLKILPEIQRKMICVQPETQHAQTKYSEVAPPKPLSTVLHTDYRTKKPNLLNSVLDKVNETRNIDAESDSAPSTSAQDHEVIASEPFTCPPATPRSSKTRRSILETSHSRAVEPAPVSPPPSPAKPKIPQSSSLNLSPSFPPKRQSLYYTGAEALSLLATPTVAKRQPGAPRTEPVSMATPQSILKVKRIVKHVPSPRSSPKSAGHPSSPTKTVNPPSALRGPAESRILETGSSALETPTRKIRFAAMEDSPPRVEQPSTSKSVQLEEETRPEPVETIRFPGINWAVQDMDDIPVEQVDEDDDDDDEEEDEEEEEEEENEDEEDAGQEMQITATVVDITEQDSAEEVDDDDSSYIGGTEEETDTELEENGLRVSHVVVSPEDQDVDIISHQNLTTVEETEEVPSIIQEEPGLPSIETSQEAQEENRMEVEVEEPDVMIQHEVVSHSPAVSESSGDAPFGLTLEASPPVLCISSSSDEEEEEESMDVRMDNALTEQVESEVPLTQEPSSPESQMQSVEEEVVDTDPGISQGSPQPSSSQEPSKPEEPTSGSFQTEHMGGSIPDTIVEELSPLDAPSSLLAAPSSPVAAPSSPVAAPSSPVAAPSSPVAAPSSPVAAPSSPVAAPSSPVAASSQGAGQAEEPAPTSSQMVEDLLLSTVEAAEEVETHDMESEVMSAEPEGFTCEPSTSGINTQSLWLGEVDEWQEGAYPFSPPTSVKTPARQKRHPVSTTSAPPSSSTPFLFSPPMTRSRRRTLDVTPASTRKNTRSRRSETVQETPTDSPLTFSVVKLLTPVSSPSTPSRKTSPRRKVVHMPRHQMTLRARKCPKRSTHIADLAHSHSENE